MMVGIKILVLLFFMAVSCWWIQPANWTPFAPNGWAGISAGAAIVFFAYIGFDAVSTVAEETKDPQRTLPLGILASLVICTIFYIAVAAVFKSAQPAAHDAHTAYTGIWLALVGTTLLFFIRGFHLWLEALKKQEGEGNFLRAIAALLDVLRPEPWLELSWFLIIPLAFTACVLCSTIIQRVLRARQIEPGNASLRVITISFILAVILAIAAVVYVLLVAVHAFVL